MTTRVRIAELKDHLSAHLRAVEAGETVEVLEIRGATAYVHPVPTLEY